MTPPPRLLGLPDGAYTGTADGRLARVFRPRWWELRRWVRWLLLPDEYRTLVVVSWVVPVVPPRTGKKIVRAFVVPGGITHGPCGRNATSSRRKTRPPKFP